MKLDWVKDPNSANRYEADSFEYRYVMLVPKRGRVHVRVYHFDDHGLAKPIDERACVSRHRAEHVAQRFEDSGKARRLR
jgi:gamma-glutamylcyclotransferase (GGCT)/AIG2-like uncharacterized protein YtfP